MTYNKKTTKKKDELTGMNRVTLEATKRGFVLLCKQYKVMGQLLHLQAKTLSHPMFSKTMMPVIISRLLAQYHEVGDQMKVIGTGLDNLGGEPELGSKKFPHPTFKKPLRNDIKDSNEAFVSNIKPISKIEKG